MKINIIILFLFSFCLMTIPAQSQTPNKELQENINKYKKNIDDLEKKIADARIKKEDPATIKMMEDQLAMMKQMIATFDNINREINKDISKNQDKTIRQTPAQDDNIGSVLKRDSKRIKMLPDGILTNAELVVFVKKIHSETERLLPVKDKTEALKIYSAAKSEKRSPAYIANITNSLWMVGYNELAIYILGKECTADISNTNNLNNYAAFLTMAGGEHAALPILQNLQIKYPGNSTILNNIGQAWFGLGEMNNANRFLDSAIKLYPRHSEANLTKSIIQQAEGKTQEAIESIKRAIQENYTAEKEVRLVKLGGKLEYGDVPFRYTMKPEPLGFEKFILTIPAYTMDGGMAAAISETEWNDFRDKLRAVQGNIKEQIKILKIKADAYNARLLANPMILMPYNNTVYRTAKRKMALLFEWMSDRVTALDKKKRVVKDSVEKWREEIHKPLATHARDRSSQDLGPDCGFLNTIATAFNSKVNPFLQQHNNELLSFSKQFYNTWANLSLYAATDKSQYDLWIATIKAGMLDQLAQLDAIYEGYVIGFNCTTSPPQEQQGKGLPDFDSLTCQYKDEIFIPPFTTMKFECNKMSTEFDIDTELGLKIKVGWVEDLNRNKITKGTLELAYEKGINEGYEHLGGPFKGEIKVEGALGIEVTETGVKEVYIKGGISGEVTGYVPSEESLPGFVEGNKGFMESKGSSAFNLELKSSWNAGSKGKESSISTGVSGEGLSSGGIFKNINWTTPQIKSN